MTVHAFPDDWTVSKVLYTGAAVVAAGAMIAGAAAFIADGARNTVPTGTATPAATATAPAPSTYLAPHCGRAAMGGTENCAWEPVADCLSDEDGDGAIPDGYAGCRWDAARSGNGRGTSYVIWRRN